MSKSSVVGQFVHSATHITDFTTPSGLAKNPFLPGESLIADAYNSLTKKPPTPATAGNLPDPNAATQAALQNQANQEVNIRAQRSLYTSGQGLLDSPQTAGTTLLGS